MSEQDPGTSHLPLTVAEMAELAGGLAHELRNPLSTIKINLKLLAEDLGETSAGAEDMRRRALLKLATLQHETDRLQALFDDFLNVTGPCRLHRVAVDLNAVVRKLANFYEPLASGRGVRLVLDLAGDLPAMPIDERLISQALLNLVINAQEAMPEGGELRISTRYQDGFAEITVTDQGVGISPEHRARIFRPFFSTKGTGTGLGLSVTRRIVLEHGGSIEFASEAGRGTTFSIRLPLDKPSAA